MKQPLPGAFFNRLQGKCVSTANTVTCYRAGIDSVLCFILHAESPITTWLLLSGVDANGLHSHGR